MMYRLSTKDTHEREDAEAERLVKPSPKLKPPRRDLRRQTTDADRDTDTSGDPDLKGDPDMSMNYKNVGGSLLHRVVARFIEADVHRGPFRNRPRTNKTPLQQHGGRRQRKNPQDDELVKVWDRTKQKNVYIPKGTADRNRQRYQPPKDMQRQPQEDRPSEAPKDVAPQPSEPPVQELPQEDVSQEGAPQEDAAPRDQEIPKEKGEESEKKQEGGKPKSTQDLVMSEIPENERDEFWKFVVEQDTTDTSTTPVTIYDPKADDWLPVEKASEAAGRELIQQYQSARQLTRLQSAYAPLLNDPNASKTLDNLSLLGGRSLEKGEKELPITKTLRELKQKKVDLSRVPVTKYGIPEALGMPVPKGVKSVQDLVDASTKFYNDKKKKSDADKKKLEEEKSQQNEEKLESDKLKMFDSPDYQDFLQELGNADFDDSGNPVFLDPYADSNVPKALVPFNDLSEKAQAEIVKQFNDSQRLKDARELVRKSPELRTTLQQLKSLRTRPGKGAKETDLIKRLRALKDSGQKFDNMPASKYLPELKGKLPDGVATIGDLIRLADKTTIAPPNRPAVSDYDAQQMFLYVSAALPDEMEVQKLEGLHPEDQDQIVNAYYKWERSSPDEIKDFIKKLGGLPDNIDEMDPPKKITIEGEDGKVETVDFDSLSEDEKSEHFQKYKNDLKGLQILKRTAETAQYQEQGVPSDLSKTLVYETSRDPKELFNSFEKNFTARRSKAAPLSLQDVKKLYKGMSPQQQKQTTAYYQAQDYAQARVKYLQEGLITEYLPLSQVIQKLQEASDELDTRAKVYPKDTTIYGVSQAFRSNVLNRLKGSSFPQDNYEGLQKWILERDSKDYENFVKKYEKDKAEGLEVGEFPPPPEGYVPPEPDLPEGLSDAFREKPKRKPKPKRKSKRKPKTATEKVVARYLFCEGSRLMSTDPHQTRQAVYWGVEPYPKGHEGFAPYNEWEQAHARDLSEKDEKALLAAAKDWLKQPILDLATMGEGPADARYRAALDFALQTLDGGRYAVALHPSKYNELLARLAGLPTNQTLTTIREASVSLYTATTKRAPMTASAQIRTYASKLASQHPALAFDLMNLSDKIAQEEKQEQAQQESKQQQKQAQQQKEQAQEEKEQAQQEAKQQKQAYMALRAAVIRTAKQNPVARLALKQALQIIQKVG